MNFMQRKGQNDETGETPNQLASSQNITFSGNDGYCEEDVVALNVTVSSNAGDHDHGSSKVKFKNVVDYNWEQRLCVGQLLAVHREGKFLAYSLTIPDQSNSGKVNGVIRVSHRSTEKRALLKGMRGQVQDLCFAHISLVLLACIDEEGNIFIFNIAFNSDHITHSVLLNICHRESPGMDHRIVWCRFIPDKDDDLETRYEMARLLLTTHGPKAYVWNVATLASKFGAEPLSLKDVAKNYHSTQDHTQPIVDAAFSSDGTAVATASIEGFVMFFQFDYTTPEHVSCAHKWSPHDGKPLSSLIFLDNLNNVECFWKFVVTGADNNSILKIWSCQSWTCMQTITFLPSPKYPLVTLKAGLDLSAKYLLLSDIHRRVLFILHFDNSIKVSNVYCQKISEFFLPSPILSFAIVDAGLQGIKCQSSCSDLYNESTIYHSPSESPDDLKDGDNEEMNQEIVTNGCEDVVNNCNICAVIRLYLIQPNRLQEGQITFVPSNDDLNMYTDKIHSSLNEVTTYEDDLSIAQAADTSALSNSHKSYIEKDDCNITNDADQPLSSFLALQSQQLKNLLMCPQVTSGYSKQSSSPLPSGNIPNMPFMPLLPLLQQSNVSANTSNQPPLNLMTPDAFSSAKRDEEGPPITESPDVLRMPPAPILDNDLQLISNSIPIDLTATENAESINSLKSNSKGFGNNQTQTTTIDGKFASGGSSPSREVQEILSVKGSDCFYEDDFDEALNTQSPQIERQMSAASNASSQNKSKQSMQDGFQSYNILNTDLYISSRDNVSQHNVSKISNASVDASCTVWPSINLQKINEANQHKSNENNELMNNLSITNIIDLAEDKGNPDVSFEKQDRNIKDSLNTNQAIDSKSIMSKLDKVIGLMIEQQKEISILRGEVATLRKIQQNNVNHSNVDEAHFIVKSVDQSNLRTQVHVKQIVDTAMSNRLDEERNNREVLLSGLSQIIGGHMAEKLNIAVAHEANNTLGPRIERILEPLVRSLQIELARKLTATDHLLTENIQKLINSKSVMDNLCIAIAHTVTSSTREAFKETIQSSLLPHMEKAQSQMFKQLNQSFSLGTKEYLAAFENCTKRSLENNSAVEETNSRAKSIVSQLQSVLDQQNKNHMLNSQMHQSIKQLNSLTKDLQTAISNTLHGALENQLSPIKECIREQITTGMAAQAAQLEDCVLSAVRSGTQTPAPSIIDVQAQQHHIDNLLSSGQTNAAFQYALSASDLKLVVYTCAMADPRQVFCNPCPLQPNVLLSLIQQLSADMTSDTQLKCSYLGEAVMYLDSENPLTKEHMPVVLRELQRQLSTFLTNNPNKSSSRQLKLLLLATDSLLKPQ